MMDDPRDHKIKLWEKLSLAYGITLLALYAFMLVFMFFINVWIAGIALIITFFGVMAFAV